MTGKTGRDADRHAMVFGSPGEKARLSGLIRTLWPLLFVVALAGYLIRAALPVPSLTVSAAGALLLLLAMVLALVSVRCEKRLSSFLRGARGEEWVAHELAFLPADHFVFHALSRRGGGLSTGIEDYDHIVVGPTGVFIVETKNWRGRISIEEDEIRYDGQSPSRPPLQQVKSAAAALQGTISEACGTSIVVRPVICFVNSLPEEFPLDTAGVVVCDAGSINDVILDEANPQIPADAAQRVGRYLQALLLGEESAAVG
jgi:hypothetical protein